MSALIAFRNGDSALFVGDANRPGGLARRKASLSGEHAAIDLCCANQAGDTCDATFFFRKSTTRQNEVQSVGVTVSYRGKTWRMPTYTIVSNIVDIATTMAQELLYP